jgi:hypothetical protein
LLNTIFESDSNRKLAVELNGINPLLTILRTSSYEDILIVAVEILVNISFNNGYTANCVLLAGGGEVLLDVLEGGMHTTKLSPILKHDNRCRGHPSTAVPRIYHPRGLLEYLQQRRESGLFFFLFIINILLYHFLLPFISICSHMLAPLRT